MSQYIQIIKNKLNRLISLDKELNIFGASIHRYQFNSVANEALLHKFEVSNKCIFPKEYRDFLLYIGNGGAGPGYGVFPMGMMDDGFDLSPWDGEFVQPEKQFPFSEALNDTSILERGEPKKDDSLNSEEYEKKYDQWWDRYGEKLQLEYWEKHALIGAIPIAHHGCAYRSWLVVSKGQEYGKVWQDDTADSGGVYPLQSQTLARYTFYDWYLEWLDKSIDELS